MAAPTYTTPADEEFLAAIGRLALSWAQVECGIDLTLFVLHHNLNGRAIEPVLPWSLKRKIKYIRRATNALAAYGRAFETLAPAVTTLMSEIDAASEFRHDVLHGFALEYAEGSGEAEMARFLRGADPYQRKEFRVTTHQILEQAVLAGKLGGRAMKLALGLQQIVKMASEIQD